MTEENNDRRYVDNFSFVSSAATGVGCVIQVEEKNQGQDDGQDSDDGDNETQGAEAETAETGLASSQTRCPANLMQAAPRSTRRDPTPSAIANAVPAFCARLTPNASACTY
jgi:hypothetical protein